MDPYCPSAPLLHLEPHAKTDLTPSNPVAGGEYLVGPAWVRHSLSDPVISDPGHEIEGVGGGVPEEGLLPGKEDPGGLLVGGSDLIASCPEKP